MSLEIPPHAIIGALIPFHTIDPHTMRLCIACADRASQVVRDYLKIRQPIFNFDPDPMLIRMDYAVAVLFRKYDVARALTGSDHDFCSDFAAIQKSIDRSCGVIPEWVMLRFAGNGFTGLPM